MRSGNGIPHRALLACGALGARLPSGVVAEAIAAGLLEAGQPPADLCPLPPGAERPGAAGQALDEVDFTARMRAARAVVLATAVLRQGNLAGSLHFEIATRARQSGIPCFAVVAENQLDRFDVRIMDLQLVLQARSRAKLMQAGRTLAALL